MATAKPKRIRRRKDRSTYPMALPCVLVAVDPGNRAGWATFLCGRPVTWGEVDAYDAPRIEEILLAACELAVRSKLPLVLLGEDWGTVRGAFGGAGAREGLAAAWGSWRYAGERLHDRGLPVLPSRVTRVNVQTWKQAFGLAGLRTEHAKPYAIRAVKERLGIALAPEHHNAAEALLIGLWGARAGVVGARLPVRTMKAAGLYRERASR